MVSLMVVLVPRGHLALSLPENIFNLISQLDKWNMTIVRSRAMLQELDQLYLANLAVQAEKPDMETARSIRQPDFPR